MTTMDTTEAARALFFLQTSPVLTSSRSERFFPSLDLGASSAATSEDDEGESRSVAISPHHMKPGSALMALLDLNKICQQNGVLAGRDCDSSPSSSPRSLRSVKSMKNMRTFSLSMDETMTRDRSESVAAIEKRFSSESMSVGQTKIGHLQTKIGHYSREERRRLIDRFLQKRNRRIWRKRVKYDVRKSFADSRLRVKGRFVRKEDEDQLRELLILSF